MIFSEKHRFIFFAAGKTGTTSIEEVLRPYAEPPPFVLPAAGDDDAKHVPPRAVAAALGAAALKAYFTFAFVRNPWDWVLSNYFWNRALTAGRWGRWRRRLGLARDIRTFREAHFRRHWEAMKRFRRGTHAENRFQFAFLADEAGRLLVDFVGRYERLQADFDTICDRIGLPRVRLPHTNQGRGPRRPYVEYYTDATRDLVASHYKKDIESFGYRFGD